MTQVTDSAAEPTEAARKDCCEPASSCNTEGFAARFECRPEYQLGRYVVADVINASTVPQRTVNDLMVMRIADVLTGNDEVFLGFGIPNSYLVVPKASYNAAKGESPYQKFAGKSLFREPSTIQDTRGWVQSGMWIRLKGLPPEAVERLREAMQYYDGVRFVTCVRACMYVMQRAGFGSGKKPLKKHKWPYPLLAALTADGLTYEGKDVAFDVIRTSPMEMHNFGFRVWQATLMTFCRHAKRNKTYEAIKSALAVPFRALSKGEEKKSSPKRIVPVVAPSLPADVEYLDDIRVAVSKPSNFGALLRLVWGSHPLFTAEQPRVTVDDFFFKALPPFPQENPDRLTRLKKNLLFRPFVTARITSMLAPEFVDIGARSESNVYDMLRTHTDETPAKYNLVVTRKHIMVSHVTTPGGALTLRGKIARKLAKSADWILSKHVLMSNYSDVFFAAEVWKDADGVIHINRNSGTYQPKPYHQEAALKFAHAVFPHWRIVAED